MKAAIAPDQDLRKRLEGVRQIPTIPAVLAPLLRYMQQPMADIDVQKVTDMIAQDKSLAAQCLQMANSPVFGRWKKVDSLRAAVVGLGFQRVGDIALSCGILSILPGESEGMDPVAFWEHSLGCALVCRHFARKIAFPDPSKAYLAGLLHDLGIIVNLWVLKKEFEVAFATAKREGIPLHEAELRVLGFDHCESGKVLAQQWDMAADLTEVIATHHNPNQLSEHAALVSLVQLSDLLCRMSGLHYGYLEARQVNLLEQPGIKVLEKQCPALQDLDWARLTFEMDSYMDEVHSLVHAIYRK